jgi:hypothetical protein
MTDAAQIERLLKAVKPVIDRHAEQKNGHSYFEVPLTGERIEGIAGGIRTVPRSLQKLSGTNG